jgi:hypothetical protein
MRLEELEGLGDAVGVPVDDGPEDAQRRRAPSLLGEEHQRLGRVGRAGERLRRGLVSQPRAHERRHEPIVEEWIFAQLVGRRGGGARRCGHDRSQQGQRPSAHVEPR